MDSTYSEKLLSLYGQQFADAADEWFEADLQSSYVTVLPRAELNAAAWTNAAFLDYVNGVHGSYGLMTFRGEGAAAVYAASAAYIATVASNALGAPTGFYGGVASGLLNDVAASDFGYFIQGRDSLVHGGVLAEIPSSTGSATFSAGFDNPPGISRRGDLRKPFDCPSPVGWRLWQLVTFLTMGIFFGATVVGLFSFNAGAVGLFLGFASFFLGDLVVARHERRPVLLPPGIATGGFVAAIALAAAVVIASS